jgi:uncharacterized repeat protein (TIGR01451 family)
MSTPTIRRATQAGTVIALIGLSAGTAFAWHPKGVITKGVSNVTAGQTSVSAADTAAAAVLAKPGDTLKYTIVIANDAASSQSTNDMAFTKLTDELPDSVELVSGKTSDDLGTVKAQKSVSRTITVRVKATAKDGDIIQNKACFTGAATNQEAGSQQSGCDIALVKVAAPKATPTPTPKPTATPKATTTPTPTATPAAGSGGSTLGTSTDTLPHVGAGTLSAALGLTAMAGTTAAYIRSRRRK